MWPRDKKVNKTTQLCRIVDSVAVLLVSSLRNSANSKICIVTLSVGYELSERQLRVYFAKFGAVADLYLPKHVNGRNKGYGFLTYATKSPFLHVVQERKHVVDGKIVQVHTCLLLDRVLLCICVFQL